MRLVLTCGGRGTRLGAANPDARPKAMRDVHRLPLAEHLRLALAPTTDPRPVVIHSANDPHAPAWARSLPHGADLVAQQHPDGVANAFALAAPLLDGPALFALGDLVLAGKLESPWPDAPAVGIWEDGPPEATRANFGVRLDGGKVVELVEKPREVTGLVCGIGLYLLGPTHLDVLRSAPVNATTGEREVTEGLRELLRRGHVLHALRFRGTYLNVNTPDDLAHAEALLR